MDAIEVFADHVLSTAYDDLPAEAVQAARIFILDSLGVGLVGSAGPWARELVEMQASWGRGEDARVWSYGTRLPAPAVAMCNAYQLHNSEFDCVHEAAVVHAVTVVLPAVLAIAERRGGVSGRDLITAVTLGVDIAAHLGVAATSGLRFFRPGTAGAFAAVAGIAKVLGMDREQLLDAFSIAYGQLCGTMQAHTEGSMLLGMQIAFNARNAVAACDMAAGGLHGPRQILEGEFGYFRLFEAESDLPPVLASLGQTWRIAELAHKPWPSGRATHGIVDACLRLRQVHGIDASAIEHVAVRVPPLTFQLVGRPVARGMSVNYARLCAVYVAARALLQGGIGVEDFRPGALADEVAIGLAERVDIAADDNPDPNALSPVTVEIALTGGARHALQVDTVYGNPANPMSREDHLAKFRRNCRDAARPVPEAQAEALISMVDRLETVDDVVGLVDLMAPGEATA